MIWSSYDFCFLDLKQKASMLQDCAQLIYIQIIMEQKQLQTYINEYAIKGVKNSQKNQNHTLTPQEIKKLQLICQDGQTQDYFQELIQLYDRKEVSEGVKEICCVKLGEKLISKIENQPLHQTSLNNLYIRGQVMPIVLQYIKKKALTLKNNIFILPNQNGINFSPHKRPQILTSVIQIKKYIQIIRHVNDIIQNQIYKQKYQKKKQDNRWLIGLIIFIILTILGITLNIFVQSEVALILTSFLLIITFVYVIVYSLQVYRCEMQSVGVVTLIKEGIEKYFSFLNGVSNDSIEWKIGEYFFWIQILVHKEPEIMVQKQREKQQQ